MVEHIVIQRHFEGLLKSQHALLQPEHTVVNRRRWNIGGPRPMHLNAEQAAIRHEIHIGFAVARREGQIKRRLQWLILHLRTHHKAANGRIFVCQQQLRQTVAIEVRQRRIGVKPGVIHKHRRPIERESQRILHRFGRAKGDQRVAVIPIPHGDHVRQRIRIQMGELHAGRIEIVMWDQNRARRRSPLRPLRAAEIFDITVSLPACDHGIRIAISVEIHKGDEIPAGQTRHQRVGIAPFAAVRIEPVALKNRGALPGDRQNHLGAPVAVEIDQRGFVKRRIASHIDIQCPVRPFFELQSRRHGEVPVKAHAFGIQNHHIRPAIGVDIPGGHAHVLMNLNAGRIDEPVFLLPGPALGKGGGRHHGGEEN